MLLSKINLGAKEADIKTMLLLKCVNKLEMSVFANIGLYVSVNKFSNAL